MLKKILRIAILPFFFLLLTNFKSNNKEYKLSSNTPDFLKDTTQWVDSVFQSLTVEERIAQSIMMAAYQYGDSAKYNAPFEIIQKYNIGGIIFFQGGPKNTVLYENKLQSLAKTPLLMTIDGEWGLAMRLDSTIAYPKQMMLGAMGNDQLIYQMGCDIASQLKRMGLQSNLSPVTDINNNPQNPVIGIRSFGEDRYKVVEKSLAYMNGLQDNKILVTAKHFPGHGDTETDSHLALPKLTFSVKRIDSLELYPYQQLINNKLSGIMVAHLNVPALDSSGVPSTLSHKIVTGLLKEKLGFQGLIFTDGLNMKGVADHKSPDDIAYEAYMAGNDILLMPDEIPLVIQKIKSAIDSNLISIDEVNQRCKKILLAKYWVGLNNYKPVDTAHLYADLHKPAYEMLQRKLIESSITVLKNENNILPIKRLDTLKIACLSIGYSDTSEFQKYVGLYAPVDFYSINRSDSDSAFEAISQKLKKYNLIIASIVNTDIRVIKKFGITDRGVDFIKKLADSSNVIFDLFASPYALQRFEPLNKFKSIIISYEDKDFNQQLSAQLIFGGISPMGRLPVKASDEYLAGNGLLWNSNIRVKYTIPEEVGIDRNQLFKIDTLVNNAIKSKALPGCVIYLAKDGKVFYNKSFGYFTYDSLRKVIPTDIYDLASVTKIAATTPAIMMLDEQNKININSRLSKYLPELKHSNKNKILIKDVLAHQARLESFIPFYLQTLRCNEPGETLISNKPQSANSIKTMEGEYINCNTKFVANTYNKTDTIIFTVKVADSLYIRNDWHDSIINKINQSALLPKSVYHYSDLGFILLAEAVSKVTKQSINQFDYDNLYKPLGATTLGYDPLIKFDKTNIAPTEDDKIYRKQLIQGYVHDPTAAMFGGIAGHAGLFSNANDLGKLMQLYLNKGEYGGTRYFKSATIDLYTSRPFLKNHNRRALGFDKPEPDTSKQSPVDRCVSDSSYGHTGFTGTMVWVDPKYNLVYIFLSNRVYPDASENKLAESNLRTNIQKIIYNTMIKK
jgi:beta-glucosidase-like glycosyl hydrolase/CubicO group peptidase (beta-lactamase class C family)